MKIVDWMRELDHVENASLEWLLEWVNRRPIAELVELQEVLKAADAQLFGLTASHPVRKQIAAALSAGK